MIFFSDALEGQVVTTTPSAASVCLDKNVRTGQTTASGTALSVALSWTTAVSYDAVALVYSNGTRFGITPTGVTAKTGTVTAGSRQFAYEEFTVSSGTGLTVQLQNGGTLSEIYVLKEIFEIPDSERPMRYRNFATDPGRHAYRTMDQSLISYAGLSTYGKADILVGWDYLSKARVDDFRDLFYGPPLRKPFFIYPEPDERPNEVFQVYWDNDFSPRPSAASLLSGYTLDVNLVEV